MKTALIISVLSVGSLAFVGCASQHEEGVKSSYHSQWTTVAADTEETTEAAEAVLKDDGLKEVTSTSTKVDGTAMAKKADGTKVNVSVKRESDKISQVSVTVGTMGDPELGADIAKRIKMKAEGTTR